MTRKGAIALVISALCLAGCERGGAGAGAPGGAEHELTGVEAPDFALAPTGGGAAVSPRSVRGKVLVVDFWATWCQPCRESFPVYQELVAQHAGDLVVIGVSEDESGDGIGAFAKETGAKFPLVWDEDKSVARAFKPPAMPTSYFVDRAGVIQFVHEGFRRGDDAVIRAHVADLLAR